MKDTCPNLQHILDELDYNTHMRYVCADLKVKVLLRGSLATQWLHKILLFLMSGIQGLVTNTMWKKHGQKDQMMKEVSIM